MGDIYRLDNGAVVEIRVAHEENHFCGAGLEYLDQAVANAFRAHWFGVEFPVLASVNYQGYGATHGPTYSAHLGTGNLFWNYRWGDEAAMIPKRVSFGQITQPGRQRRGIRKKHVLTHRDCAAGRFLGILLSLLLGDKSHVADASHAQI